MISDRMQEAMNKHINAELYSSYLYLSMSAWFEANSLGGFGNWMRIQAQEEMVHAMKFYDYICERGGEVKLLPIDGPPVAWDSAVAVFENGYAHEQLVSSLINDLMAVAREENDNASVIFLEWFVSEQVEEEKSADDMVQALRMIGDSGHGIFMFDRDAGARVFTPPPVAE